MLQPQHSFMISSNRRINEEVHRSSLRICTNCTSQCYTKNNLATVIRPDLVWYDENVNWLKHLVSSNGTEQKIFLKKMTQKQDLTVLTVDRLPGIDQTFDCWVILAFDSTEPMQCKYIVWFIISINHISFQLIWILWTRYWVISTRNVKE